MLDMMLRAGLPDDCARHLNDLFCKHLPIQKRPYECQLFDGGILFAWGAQSGKVLVFRELYGWTLSEMKKNRMQAIFENDTELDFELLNKSL